MEKGEELVGCRSLFQERRGGGRVVELMKATWDLLVFSQAFRVSGERVWGALMLRHPWLSERGEAVLHYGGRKS